MSSTFTGPVISKNGFQAGVSGSSIQTIIRGQVTFDPASVAATTVADQTFTVTGALANDTVVINPPTTALTAGMLVCQAHVSAADTVKVRLYNTTGSPIDLASGSWTYCLIR